MTPVASEALWWWMCSWGEGGERGGLGVVTVASLCRLFLHTLEFPTRTSYGKSSGDHRISLSRVVI
jgi:hypothetical protein